MYTNLHPRQSPDSSPTPLPFPCHKLVLSGAERSLRFNSFALNLLQTPRHNGNSPSPLLSIRYAPFSSPRRVYPSSPHQRATPKTQPLHFQYLAHSFAHFCTHREFNSFLFNRFRTLCQKHPGWGGTPSPNSTFYLSPISPHGTRITGHRSFSLREYSSVFATQYSAPIASRCPSPHHRKRVRREVCFTRALVGQLEPKK